MVKKTAKKDEINYKKMFFEIIITLSILFVAMLFVVLPAVSEKITGNDPNYHRKAILRTVDEYDYSKGRDKELENELKNGWESRDVKDKYYYGLASAVYYCNIGYYNTAREMFYAIYEYKITTMEEELDYDARQTLCERKIANEN